MKDFDPLKILKGCLIGAGAGAVAGGGLTVYRTLKQKKQPASKDLSIQTLNLDAAAPDLIPTLMALEEMVEGIPAENKVAWRQLCTTIIQSCDRLFNIIVMIQRKEIKADHKAVGEVEVWARHVTACVTKLQSLLPAEQPGSEEGLSANFQAFEKEIQDTVGDTWINLRNKV